MALSIRKPSIYVNPREFEPTMNQLHNMANLLDVGKDKLKKISKKTSYFSWVKRKADPSRASRLIALGIPGVYQITEPSRFYPVSPAAANLVGYVNVDDKGMMGIERQYERELQGAQNRLDLYRDAKGRTIFERSDAAVPESGGMDVHLTIDRAIQEIAENALSQGVKRAKAKGGFAIVADPHTGQILAVANNPSYNQNARRINVKRTWNNALMDVFEPGSIMKTFVIGGAIEDGLVRPTDKFDCEGGVYRRGSVRFNDSHKPKTQYLSVNETLVTSSNVCTYKVAQKLGPQSMYDYYKLFGFGSKESGIGFPAQSFGRLTSWESWRPIRFANLAFGQGLTTTALEVIQAYSAIANGGQLMKPYLVNKIASPTGQIVLANSTTSMRRVLKPETTRVLRQMLQQVVEEGAVKAKIEGYSSGGKTGTSQKVDPNTKRYSHSLHRAAFAGIAPITDPHLTIFVVIDEPGIAPHYGSLWAAPVFSDIAGKTLRYLNVATDLPINNAKTSSPPEARAL